MNPHHLLTVWYTVQQWGVYAASTKQTIYAGVQENGCRNHEKEHLYPAQTMNQ